MWETVFIYLISILFSWLSLFITGRIVGKSQSMWEGEPASPKDDALAAIVIVLLTLAADAVSYYLLGSLPISFLVYWGLIYFAFQLKGIGDLITFWFIQGIVTFGLMWLGIVPLFMLAQA